MKKIFFLLTLPLLSNFCYAQKDAAERMITEGVALYDKGDYAAAIVNYDKALQFDPDNYTALAEKALTLLAMEKYDEAIESCKTAIGKHPDEKDLAAVYVTYGNALDGLKKTEEAISIYDEGIKKFPKEYQLPFNKGIALAGQEKYDEALLAFEKAVKLNPLHAGSNNAIARLQLSKQHRIPALLAFGRFFIIEPETDRAAANLVSLKKIMGGAAEKTGRNSVTVNITPDMLADTTADGKNKENSFTSTDLILAMSSALDFDKKNKKKSEAELFRSKFETVCASLSETAKDNHGFYWEFYVPYFTEMYNKNLVEAFSYIVYASSKDPDVTKWLKSHKPQIAAFYEWSRGYNWPKEI